MLTRHNPKAVHAPASPYSHATEVPPNARWLYLSGQVGVKPDGSTVKGVEGQIDQAFRNVLALLAEAGMGPADIVRLNGYLVRPEDVKAYRDIRVRHLGSAEPASTLVIVAGLASSDWLVEVEAVAAKASRPAPPRRGAARR